MTERFDEFEDETGQLLDRRTQVSLASEPTRVNASIAQENTAAFSDVTDAELDSLLTDLERFNDDQASVVVPLASLSDQPSIPSQRDRATLPDKPTYPSKPRTLFLASDLPPLPTDDSQKIEITASPNDKGATAALESLRIESSAKRPAAALNTLHLSERIALLKDLSKSQKGNVRAGLLVSAAELCEQVGDATQARALYKEALSAAPFNILALRALRRDALMRKSWTEAAQLLESEASLPLNAEERALALVFLAELQWQKLDNPQAAISAAKQALALRPQSVAAGLLLFNLYITQGQEHDAYAVINDVAYHWHDKAVQAVLFTDCARFAERQGNVKQARQSYESALTLVPTALEVLFGIVRTARATSDINRAIEALHNAEAIVPEELKAPLKWLRSRWLHLVAARPEEALRAVAGSQHPLTVRTTADGLLAKGDLHHGLPALKAWIEFTGSTERALALAELALNRLKEGKLEETLQLLKEAALADGAIGSIRAIRELAVQKYGVSTELLEKEPRLHASETSSESPIRRAAHFVQDPRGFSEELYWLKRAAQDDEDALCADVLLLDVACCMHDEQSIAVGLENQALRTPPHRRVGVLLALSELAARSADHERAEEFLEQARDIAQDQPVVLRPLGRLKHAKGPHAAAELWLKEALATEGPCAAFAATMAARLFESSNQPIRAIDALHLAFKAVPSYEPAVWCFERIALNRNDYANLARLYETLLTHTSDPQQNLHYLFNAILRHRDAKSPQITHLIEQALARVPSDPILRDIAIRHEGVSANTKASLMVQHTEDYPAIFAQAQYLRATWTLQDASLLKEARPFFETLRSIVHDNDIFISRILDYAEDPNIALENCLHGLERTQEDATTLLLDRLTALELQNLNLPVETFESLQRFIEHQPNHIPTLRTLHRFYSQINRPDAEATILTKFSMALTSPSDQAATARLGSRLLLSASSARPSAADKLLFSLPKTALIDPWIARRTTASAMYTKRLELSAIAYQHLAPTMSHALERAAFSLRAAWMMEQTDNLPQAANYLEKALQGECSHNVAFEELARLCMQAKEAKSAARYYESAALLARVPRHALALWHRAGMLWHDEVGDQPKAIHALGKAAAIDISYADVFNRLRRLLDDHGELKDLAELTLARLSAGGNPKTLVELHVQLADLYRRLGKPIEAKTQLETALALEPDHLNALRNLGELYVTGQEWKDATDTYIRIARLSRDHNELHRIFFELGNIYDQHITDLKRSEAAFRRVIKLSPNDMLATQRLADIYMRENDLERAIVTFQKLIDMDLEPDRNRQHRLRLAEAFERHGNIREAEHTLELARKNSPADLVVMETLATFYERQQAQSAYVMHLNRATDDFRQAIRNDLSDAAAWHGLVKVLQRRSCFDAARTCASAALAAGVVDIELSRLLSPEGAALITPSKTPEDALDQLLAPPMLSPAVRMIFALTDRVMEKLFPLNLKVFHATRVSKRDPIRMTAHTVANWLSLPTPQVYVTDATSRLCAPLTNSPPSVLISQDLLTATTDHEQIFLIARSLKVSSSCLSITARTSPYDIAVALAAVVHCGDPEFYPPGIDPAVLVDYSQQLRKNLSKRVLQELHPHTRVIAAMEGFDPGALGALAFQLGSRYALVATGSAPAAVNALLKLNGIAEPNANLALRLSAIRRFSEIASLLNFAISDEHFEARRRIMDRVQG